MSIVKKETEQKFYSGVNGLLALRDLELNNGGWAVFHIQQFSYQFSANITPVYGVFSQMFDYAAKGTMLVQGEIVVTYTAELQKQLEAQLKKTQSNYLNVGKEDAQLYIKNVETLDEGTTTRFYDLIITNYTRVTAVSGEPLVVTINFLARKTQELEEKEITTELESFIVKENVKTDLTGFVPIKIKNPTLLLTPYTDFDGSVPAWTFDDAAYSTLYNTTLTEDTENRQFFPRVSKLEEGIAATNAEIFEDSTKIPDARFASYKGFVAKYLQDNYATVLKKRIDGLSTVGKCKLFYRKWRHNDNKDGWIIRSDGNNSSDLFSKSNQSLSDFNKTVLAGDLFKGPHGKRYRLAYMHTPDLPELEGTLAGSSFALRAKYKNILKYLFSRYFNFDPFNTKIEFLLYEVGKDYSGNTLVVPIIQKTYVVPLHDDAVTLFKSCFLEDTCDIKFPGANTVNCTTSEDGKDLVKKVVLTFLPDMDLFRMLYDPRINMAAEEVGQKVNDPSHLLNKISEISIGFLYATAIMLKTGASATPVPPTVKAAVSKEPLLPKPGFREMQPDSGSWRAFTTLADIQEFTYYDLNFDILNDSVSVLSSDQLWQTINYIKYCDGKYCTTHAHDYVGYTTESRAAFLGNRDISGVTNFAIIIRHQLKDYINYIVLKVNSAQYADLVAGDYFKVTCQAETYSFGKLLETGKKPFNYEVATKEKFPRSLTFVYKGTNQTIDRYVDRIPLRVGGGNPKYIENTVRLMVGSPNKVVNLLGIPIKTELNYVPGSSYTEGSWSKTVRHEIDWASPIQFPTGTEKIIKQISRLSEHTQDFQVGTLITGTDDLNDPTFFMSLMTPTGFSARRTEISPANYGKLYVGLSYTKNPTFNLSDLFGDEDKENPCFVYFVANAENFYPGNIPHPVELLGLDYKGEIADSIFTSLAVAAADEAMDISSLESGAKSSFLTKMSLLYTDALIGLVRFQENILPVTPEIIVKINLLSDKSFTKFRSIIYKLDTTWLTKIYEVANEKISFNLDNFSFLTSSKAPAASVYQTEVSLTAVEKMHEMFLAKFTRLIDRLDIASYSYYIQGVKVLEKNMKNPEAAIELVIPLTTEEPSAPWTAGGSGGRGNTPAAIPEVTLDQAEVEISKQQIVSDSTSVFQNLSYTTTFLGTNTSKLLKFVGATGPGFNEQDSYNDTLFDGFKREMKGDVSTFISLVDAAAVSSSLPLGKALNYLKGQVLKVHEETLNGEIFALLRTAQRVRNILQTQEDQSYAIQEIVKYMSRWDIEYEHAIAISIVNINNTGTLLASVDVLMDACAIYDVLTTENLRRDRLMIARLVHIFKENIKVQCNLVPGENVSMEETSIAKNTIKSLLAGESLLDTFKLLKETVHWQARRGWGAAKAHIVVPSLSIDENTLTEADRLSLQIAAKLVNKLMLGLGEATDEGEGAPYVYSLTISNRN